MDRRIKTWIYDIIKSIDEIDGYFESSPKTYEFFISDLRTRRAIERNLEIIGEAMGRILAEDIDFPVECARDIVGTRNRIIHGYDRVSEQLIWSIVINNLPKLHEELIELL